jgi:hypothetical protein
MPDVDKLDRLLMEAGERWRAGQEPAPSIDAVWRRPAHTTDLRWGWVLVAAGVTLVLAAGLLSTGGRPQPPAASRAGIAWDDAQVRAAQIRVGDIVTATGFLEARPDQPPKLCMGGLDLLMVGVAPECSSPSVDLYGLNLPDVPGRQVAGDVTYAYPVTVIGRWDGARIEYPVVKAALAANSYSRPLPCPTPATGWPNPDSSGAFRSALDPLAREIAGHPELYAAYATLPLGALTDSVPAVELVRTKVDPTSVAARLESLFPYALCITRDYSDAELEAANVAFAAGPVSMPTIDQNTHRVGVEIIAVDDQTLPTFLAHPAAYPIPLVTRYVATAPQASPTPTSTVPVPSVPASCPVTLPDSSFQAPAPYPPVPRIPNQGWVGTSHLWTMVSADGRGWAGSPSATTGISVKTFWWSADWTMHQEPAPPILVAGHRLDGPGSFAVGPGTNASNADIGTAMLVGVEFPSIGCWQEIGYYRQASVSYVVWVASDSAAETGPPISQADVDAMTAREVATQFEQARTIPSWDVAWGDLSSYSQGLVGSKEAFIAAETSFNAEGGLRYEVGPAQAWPWDGIAAPGSGYFSPALLADLQTKVDLGRAFFVTIAHPDVNGASLGSSSYVVAPLSGGDWRVWIVH